MTGNLFTSPEQAEEIYRHVLRLADQLELRGLDKNAAKLQAFESVFHIKRESATCTTKRKDEMIP